MQQGARNGDWVRIHAVVLDPDQRSARLPAETAQVPLEMWVKGALIEERAELGDAVTVHTATGRVVRGRLDAVHPAYGHGFGTFVAELHEIGLELRHVMEGERHDSEPQL